MTDTVGFLMFVKITNCFQMSVLSHSLLLFFLFLAVDLNQFPTDERESVNVKEGQGAVLLCSPPSRYPSKTWTLSF